jgi:hypothetical protein
MKTKTLFSDLLLATRTKWNRLRSPRSAARLRASFIAEVSRLLLIHWPKRLLTNGETNTKVAKGTSVRTFLLSLVPSDTLIFWNLCPFASAACRRLCLFTAGRGIMRNVSEGRIRKALAFKVSPMRFVGQLEKEILAKVKTARRIGSKIAFRLNVVSDVDWYRFLFGTIATTADVAIFYDYTAVPSRMRRYLAGEYPSNVHLTFSLKENNRQAAAKVLSLGGSVAVVFDTLDPASFPDRFLGYQVINGELSDQRFLDPPNVVVALTPKGFAKREDDSGFKVALNDVDCNYGEYRL